MSNAGTRMTSMTPLPWDEPVTQAFRRGDLPGAAGILEAHLAGADDPEASLQLGRILCAVGRGDEATQHLLTALAQFTEAGLTQRAAVAAAEIGLVYLHEGANRTAGRPWLARARRMVGNLEPCVEQGWVLVKELGCNIDDAAVLLERTETALDIARRFCDGALEAKALADHGLALVDLGRVREGMEEIDEAVALLLTGVTADPVIVGMTCCSLFSACARAGDFSRVQSWAEILREHNFIGERGSAILTGHCESVYGGLMCNLGRWDEGESALLRAMEITHDTIFAGRIHALSALAELRIQQGRLDEAERLLVGLDDYMEVLIPAARLHLARQDFALAVCTARRGLRLLGSDRLRTAALLSVLVEAELGAGDLAAAAAASEQLDDLVADHEIIALAAEAAFARGRVLESAGEVAQAVAELERAVAALVQDDLPLLRAKLHLELARLHAESDPTSAAVEARAAAAIHARLGLAEAPEPRGPRIGPEVAKLGRRPAGWVIERGSMTHRLRDTKGLHYLFELLAHPGVERHALDLVNLTDPVDADGAALRASLRDGGAVLDDRAKAAYRRRIEDLRAAIDDAEELGHDQEASRHQDEIDRLVRELSAALGLGGRDRRVASGAERARLNVTRAIRAAITRITEDDRQAGAALDRHVRTGIFCSYQPGSDSEVVWQAVRSGR